MSSDSTYSWTTGALMFSIALAVCLRLASEQKSRTRRRSFDLTEGATPLLKSRVSSATFEKTFPGSQPNEPELDGMTSPLRRKMSVTAPSIKFFNEDFMHGRLLKGCTINEVRLHDISSLKAHFPSEDVLNEGNIGYNKLIGVEDFIISDLVRKTSSTSPIEAFVRAGPREKCHFDPTRVRAAVVTCGGLCPGLNTVIRELVRALHYLYGVEKIIGIKGGFNGFLGKPGYDPVQLTIDRVADCHHQGGTILASSRGGFELDTIVDFLINNDINQLYVIGGDGTHRGANTLSEEVIRRKLNIAVVGIPKTIDNDVDLIDKSFGFTTSVEAAQAAIISAKTEARCNLPNGIGIVKLMGRSAGFIASHATLASGDVDLCLVPEVSIDLLGPNGILPFLMERVASQGHAVVVVAEGAGEEMLGTSCEVDAGGNKKLPPIGEFLKAKITDYFKEQGNPATVKYIDPSYMIRSVPPNASDALMCMLLAQNSVHGAMAGYTGFTTGVVNNRVVYIPIPRLVATSPRVMDPRGRTWERILAMTRQPNSDPMFNVEETTVSQNVVL